MTVAVLATIVDTSSLLKSVAGSILAATAVALSFSIAILGVTRFAELRRDGRVAFAFASAALAVVALIAFAAAIVLGIVAMSSK